MEGVQDATLAAGVNVEKKKPWPAGAILITG